MTIFVFCFVVFFLLFFIFILLSLLRFFIFFFCYSSSSAIIRFRTQGPFSVFVGPEGGPKQPVTKRTRPSRHVVRPKRPPHTNQAAKPSRSNGQFGHSPIREHSGHFCCPTRCSRACLCPCMAVLQTLKETRPAPSRFKRDRILLFP